jgi:hypothetical protein
MRLIVALSGLALGVPQSATPPTPALAIADAGAFGAPAPGVGSVADTTIAARPGDLLVAETLAGTLTVGVWERDEVRLEGTSSRGLRRDGATLRLEHRGGRRSGRSDRRASYVLTVPAWLDLRVGGRSLDVRIAGTGGRLVVTTLDGDVSVERTGGEVEVRTVSGDIEAMDVRGRTDLYALDGDVEVRGAAGRLRIGSTDGDLVVRGAALQRLDAETTDGHVTFEGVVLPGSGVRLATHDGHVNVSVPADADAEVAVRTFDGAFVPDFPVRTAGFRAGEVLRFVMGRGGATLDLQTFDGDIRLRHRPGGRE